MIKETFNNAGVAQVQAYILGLPFVQKQLEIEPIRINLLRWLKNYFELSSTQEAQFLILPAVLKNELAAGIADAWEADELILFNKEEDGGGLKDLIFGRKKISSYSFQNDHLTTTEQLSIWIKYQ